MSIRYAIIAWPHIATHGHTGTVVVHENGRVVDASVPLPDWQTGMSLGRARGLYTQATFVTRDRVREQALHEKMARTLVRFGPRVEALRTGYYLMQEPDLDGLIACVGNQPDWCGAASGYSEWAKLALCTAAPGTLRLVGDSETFLDETSVGVLGHAHTPLGHAGVEVAERLRLFGMHTLAEVARRLNRMHLCNQFGRDLGEQINRLLRPDRQPAVPCYPLARTVDTVHEFDRPAPLDQSWVRSAVLHLAEHLAGALNGQATLTLVLRVFVPEQGVVSDGYRSRRALWSVSDLCRLTIDLYERLCAQLATRDVLALRLVATHLVERAYAQGRLFTNRMETPALVRAVHLLQQRYGPQVLVHAQCKPSLFMEDRVILTPLGI